MSRVQAIHIDFFQHPRDEGEEFSYEQIYLFLKSIGWKLDLDKPVEFLNFGAVDVIDHTKLRPESETELLEMIRKKEAIGESLGLGPYSDGELAFTFDLSKDEFGAFNFWFLVDGELVGQEPCIVFEQLARKIVKPFCDKYDVERIRLDHG